MVQRSTVFVLGDDGPTPPPDQPPVAVITVVSINGLDVDFSGTSSYDPNGDPITAYHWDMGDTITYNTPTVQHTYSSAGTYDVTLTVTAGGLQGHDTEPVTVSVPWAEITGGTVTTPGDGWKYHTFTASGDLTCSAGGLVEWCIVGGGGAGGGGDDLGANIRQGGGGGGGVRTSDSEGPISLTPGIYPIVVGAGGVGGSSQPPADGEASSFAGITSLGGGGGNGRSGACGGGGLASSITNGAGGSGTPGQGYNGGNGAAGALANRRAGGGGGAGGPGGDGISGGDPGAGGPGLEWPSGSGEFYGGGGGGGGIGTSLGGIGGGGKGRDSNGSRASGSNGRGGGGGGSFGQSPDPGGSGGSGVVIVRVPV